MEKPVFDSSANHISNTIPDEITGFNKCVERIKENISKAGY